MTDIHKSTLKQFRRAFAFTLVELLVVLFLLMLLAAIALPTVRQLLSDQVVSRSARSVTTYLDRARSRAISEGRRVGVLVVRLRRDDAVGRSQAIRIRQIIDVPPYTGDASNSVARIQANGNGYSAVFDPADNQLLALAASMADNLATTNVNEADPQAPIRNGDLIELPGGRIVPFTIRYRDPVMNAADNVIIDFNLREPITDRLGNVDSMGRLLETEVFPSGSKNIPTTRAVKFKIHRQPIVSSVAPLDLPRGVAFDLNYSGVGVRGNQFAPASASTGPFAPNIAIVFGPDGNVVSVTESNFSPNILDTTGNTEPVARLSPPAGQVFLCLGDASGVRPDNLFAQEKKSIANVLNPKSTWVVINSSTGRAFAAPFAPVTGLPTSPVTDPTSAVVETAVAQSRLFANLSDTVDQE